MHWFKYLIAGLLAAAATGGHAAPVAAPVPAVSRVILSKPLTMLRLADLDFGTVVTSGVSGVIAIDPYSGARTLTGGVSAGPGNVGQRAAFKLTGAPAQTLVLIINPPTTLTDALGNSIPVLAMTMDGSPVRTLGPGGTLIFGVGGIIAVAADQTDGVYTATFDVMATYL